MEKGSTDEYLIYGEQLGKPAVEEIPEAEGLLRKFEEHEEKEGGFIRSYKEISEKSQDPLIKFLLQMIIADEEKHHMTMHAMASSLRGSLNWTRPEDVVPTLGEVSEEKEELLKLTTDFSKHEKEAIKESKKLLKSTKGYYQGLFDLLVKTMIHDSEKHVDILDFLRQRLRTV